MEINQARAQSPLDPLSIEAAWQSLLDRLPAAAYTCDAAGLITYFNPFAEAIWRRSPKLRSPDDRYCGSRQLYRPDGMPIRHEESYMALALREGKSYKGEQLLLETLDGKRVPGLVHAHPLRNDQGMIVGAVNLIVGLPTGEASEAELQQHASAAAIPYDAILAMIEVAVSVLTCLSWRTPAFY